MSDRSARIVIVCEDTQQQVFARRVLRKLGVGNDELRIENSPRGMSDAKQWIREKGLPTEWSAFDNYCRKNSKHRRILFVIADADNRTPKERIQDLVSQCSPAPSVDDHVCFIVRKWAIETWFKYLRDEPFDEARQIAGADKYSRARDCWPQADKLADACKQRAQLPGLPSALAQACDEFNRIKDHL